MIQISITGKGFDGTLIGFSRVIRVVNDFRGAWPSVVRELRAIMAQQFTSQGTYGGSGRWKPLSEVYAAWKRKKFPHRTILELTGAMRASLQVQTVDSVIEGSSNRLFFGTSVTDPESGYFYPIAHQVGKGVPRRPIFSLTNRQAAHLGSTIHKWIGRESSKAFSGIPFERVRTG